MKKLYLLLLCISLFISCTKEEVTIQCANIDPITQTLFIELVDDQGNNLIENGTFIAEDIIIRIGDFDFTNVVFNEIPGAESLIVLELFGEQGDNTLEIVLSDTVTDTLVLNLDKEVTGGVCSQIIYTLNRATYNGMQLSLKDFNGGYLITVVK